MDAKTVRFKFAVENPEKFQMDSCSASDEESEEGSIFSDSGESEDGLYPIIDIRNSSKSEGQLECEEDDDNKYTVRLKNLDESFTKEVIFDWFCKHATKVIVSQEYSKADKKHWHVYISDTDYEELEDLRPELKKYFKITEGNKQYCLQKVVKDQEAKSYTVKDKDYLQQGFTEQEMDIIIAKSYSKFDKQTFQTELVKLDDRFLATHDDVAWIYDFLALKAKYKQVVNTTYIKQRLRALKCRDETFCANLAITINRQMLLEEGADPDHHTMGNDRDEITRLITRNKILITPKGLI